MSQLDKRNLLLYWFEAWADESTAIPYILLLCAIPEGFVIVDPKEGDRVIFRSEKLEDAHLFLMEDEYELLEGRVECSIV